MTKSIRKYRSWLMAGVMVLLMLAWLGAPGMKGVESMRRNRSVGRLDGKKLTAQDESNASKEIAAVDAIMPGLPRFMFGIEERDWNHWLLLSKEAQEAGYVGEEADGEAFLPLLA